MESIDKAGSQTVGKEAEQHKALGQTVPNYAMMFFDHLYSEYLTLRLDWQYPSGSGPSEPGPYLQKTELLESIYQRRQAGTLTWSNIYTFDLTLVDLRPPENLVRKGYDARAKYRIVAGQREFDEYQASKPPDLASFRIAPQEDPPQPEVLIERALRADIKYLLSKVYLYYALLPMREKEREQLTGWARKITYAVVVLIAALILFNVGVVSFSEKLKQTTALIFGLTVATVAFSGILGGCVSMLQRIQSAPSEGDALFNLASLRNGWIGLSLSPLYGAIFASLLFVLFSGGILKGTIFPQINTPGFTRTLPVQTQTDLTNPNQPATPTASPSPESSRRRGLATLSISDYLRETGPADGVAFALLIIWSFIAGFAERLVPDTLNRMVAKNEKIQGTSS
jgi:hypothetical protein